MRNRVEINVMGRIIRGRPESAEEGLYLGPEGLTGWDDGLDTRGEELNFPTADGQALTPVQFATRTIGVDGIAYARSEDKLEEFHDAVVGLGADKRPFPFNVRMRGRVLSAVGEVAAKATFSDSGMREGLYTADFFLQWKCRDPYRYGDVVTVGAGDPVMNRGTAPAWPMLTVRGSRPSGYTVVARIGGTEVGRVVVTRPLTSGAHVIDVRRAQLLVNGRPQMRAMSSMKRWQVPPGSGAAVTHEVTGGSGAFSVDVRATYV